MNRPHPQDTKHDFYLLRGWSKHHSPQQVLIKKKKGANPDQGVKEWVSATFPFFADWRYPKKESPTRVIFRALLGGKPLAVQEAYVPVGADPSEALSQWLSDISGLEVDFRKITYKQFEEEKAKWKRKSK